MRKIVKDRADELLELTNPTLHIIRGNLRCSNIIDDIRILSMIINVEYGDGKFSNLVAFRSWNANVVLDTNTGKFLVLPIQYGILINKDTGIITNVYMGRYSNDYQIIKYDAVDNHYQSIEYKWDSRLNQLSKKYNRVFMDNEYIAFSICGISIFLFIGMAILGIAVSVLMILLTIRGGV